jgi:hypothetical protein
MTKDVIAWKNAPGDVRQVSRVMGISALGASNARQGRFSRLCEGQGTCGVKISVSREGFFHGWAGAVAISPKVPLRQRRDAKLLGKS